MAITSSAKKAQRQSQGRRIRNLQKTRKLKALLKEVQVLISQKKVEEAKKLLPRAQKALDKATKTGLIKKNAASRKKSRLAKAIVKSQR